MLNKLFRNALGVAALGLSCFAAAADKDSVTFTGYQPVQTTLANIETGTLQTNVFTVGGYTLGRIRFEGHLNEINGVEALAVGDYGTESRIRVKYPDGRFKDISLTTVAGYDTPTGLDVSGEFRLALGAAAPFGGGTWSFYYINTFDDNADTLADCELNLTVYLTDEEPTTPPPPAGAVDLGTVSDPGLSTTFDHVGGQIEWFKITVPEATLASKYLDIDSEGTAGIGDTEVGIYNVYGEMVANDDDDGSGLLSQLSFGPGAGNRGNVGGADYDGRDGVLDPGVYYIACGQFNVTFNPTNFDVTTTSTGSGSFTLNIRTNVVGAAGQVVNGAVTLLDRDPGSEVGQQVTVEIRNVGDTTPLYTAMATLGAGGTYSVNVGSPVPAGNYDIAIKHAKHLRKVLSNQAISATGINGADASLIAGDCDDDNSVGIGDYALVSASYNTCFPDPGFDDRSDLTGDTCCDIADYAILSANYGLNGDD